MRRGGLIGVKQRFKANDLELFGTAPHMTDSMMPAALQLTDFYVPIVVDQELVMRGLQLVDLVGQGRCPISHIGKGDNWYELGPN